MRKIGEAGVFGAALCATLIWAGSAVAQPNSVEQFYRGKTVTLMVSAPAGTLTDLVARQFKDYFSSNIPGQPTIIVANISGAGGMIAAARLQLQSANDGTVIGFLQRNNLYLPLVEDNHSGFDPREVDWIGSLDKVAYAIAVSGNSPVRTAEDMFRRRTILGATGFANDNRTLPALMNKYLGSQFRIINGYSGRGEVYLAMERGEVDGWASTIDGLQQPEQMAMIQRGQLIPLFQIGFSNHPAFPDLPNLSQHVTNPEARAVFDFFLLPFESGRPIAVPKGVPADRLAALRQAFSATVADPAFRESMRSRNWPVDPISGEQVEDILNKLYATSDETLEIVREVMGPPGA